MYVIHILKHIQLIQLRLLHEDQNSKLQNLKYQARIACWES